MSTSTQRVTAEHPYQAAGIVLMILALILVAFDLGVLARCGQGEGVCFDVGTHGTSDAALVGFFIVFVIGLVLVMYTESSSTVTRTRENPSYPANVTVMASPPPPTVVAVASPPPPTTTVVVGPHQ